MAASPIISPYPKSSFQGMLLNKKGMYGTMRALLYFHIGSWHAKLVEWLVRTRQRCPSLQGSVWSHLTLQQGCERAVWRASTWQTGVCQLALSSASACSHYYSHWTHGKPWGCVSACNTYKCTVRQDPENWALLLVILWNRSRYRYRCMHSCKWAMAPLPPVWANSQSYGPDLHLSFPRVWFGFEILAHASR